MASILKVDSIGKTSGSTQDTMAGLAKSWIDLDGSGTMETRDSFNVGSTTDNGTGSYSPTFSNNMGSANYSTPSTVGNEDDAGALIMAIVTKTTSTYRVDSESSSSNNDADRVDVTVFGDLA